MLSVSDFFCGCGGLSQGFKEAGFGIKTGIDFNKSFLETYAHNFPGTKVLNLDLGNNEFLFEPRLNIIKIAKELTIINKLAFVNEISNAPILISGPIL